MTTPDLELLEGEELMDVAEELMFRQLTDLMIDNGKPSTSAFGPASIDKGKPSYSRSEIVTAQEARDWHTEYASRPSQGVWAVTVGEVIESELIAIDDSKAPLADGALRAPGHCFADFRGLPKRKERELRTKLYFAAVARGEVATTVPLEDGQLFA